METSAPNLGRYHINLALEYFGTLANTFTVVHPKKNYASVAGEKVQGKR
jgi:hypothetical protein